MMTSRPALLPFTLLLTAISNVICAADSPPVPARPFPIRVHVFEDFETTIEKRWWLRGSEETKAENLSPSLSSLANTRCLKAAPTKDFDDKQGDPSKDFKAVIFNPVPGPPMAGNTRLSFRYRLRGTDTIRVQIYSLSNGYHRQLKLTGLEQDRWHSTDIDMTKLRRPDSTGGPLAADERIDDIQFYIDPAADLWIDDIILYEPGTTTETNPFPRRVIYSGWFDTGKQGKGTEWPGNFEIIKHDPPRTWKTAKSIIDPATTLPWLRIELRGHRPLTKEKSDLRLFFRYRLSGAEQLTISLADTAKEVAHQTIAKELNSKEWASANIRLNIDDAGPAAVDALVLRLAAKEAVLLIDDVLIYEADATTEKRNPGTKVPGS